MEKVYGEWDICPICKKGKLQYAGRGVAEAYPEPKSGEAKREHTAFKCDSCGHIVTNYGIVIKEQL
jgi:hypothetical protein